MAILFKLYFLHHGSDDGFRFTIQARFLSDPIRRRSDQNHQLKRQQSTETSHIGALNPNEMLN